MSRAGKRGTYAPDRDGVRALLLSDRMETVCVAAASAGKKHAERIAPRESGAYARSFKVLPVGIPGRGRFSPRAGAILINESGHAANVEWGGRAGGHKVLTKTRDYLKREWG